MFYLWLLSLRIREVLNINLNHPPHAVFGISLWFYGLVLLQLWYSQQEGDDANSLVIEKDNITGEIVSQVWRLSFFNEYEDFNIQKYTSDQLIHYLLQKIHTIRSPDGSVRTIKTVEQLKNGS